MKRSKSATTPSSTRSTFALALSTFGAGHFRLLLTFDEEDGAVETCYDTLLDCVRVAATGALFAHIYLGEIMVGIRSNGYDLYPNRSDGPF